MLHTYKSHCPFYPLPSNKSGRYTTLVLFNLVTPSRLTTSGILKSPEVRFLIAWWSRNHFLAHQPTATSSIHLQCAHTPHLQHLQSDPHLESSRKSVVGLLCGNSHWVNAVGCFRGGALSLMFGGILKCDSVWWEGLHHQGQLPLPPNSLVSHQTQNNRMVSWTNPTSYFSLKENSSTG